jgi:uncharacterized protein YjgD (DUF1641 family)
MNPTEETALAERLEALDRKLDLVLEEVDEFRRIRREVEELKDDLAMVGKDLFRTVVTEMDDVSPFVQTGDLTSLLKKLVRNTNNLNELLTQLESGHDFLNDATPLARKLFQDTLVELNELDEKGYFAMARELRLALDNVVGNFTVEDVHLLANNLVAILQTVKNLTQPEMLQAINNAVDVYKHINFDSVEEYSFWKAFREINKPEMRRGLGFFIAFLRNLSAQVASRTPATATTVSNQSK